MSFEDLVVLLGAVVAPIVVSYLFVLVFHSDIDKKTGRIKGLVITILLVLFGTGSMPFLYFSPAVILPDPIRIRKPE